MTEKARDFIARAEAAGCQLILKGQWVIAKPPLPVPMIMELSEISDEVSALLESDPPTQ